MTHFLTDRFSSYYERRLLDYAHNRLVRPAVKYPTYEGQQITRVVDDIYEVESSKRDGNAYSVNIATCMCTCYAGETGKICKHIYYVYSEMIYDSVNNRLANDWELMYIVACGKPPAAGWLDCLHGEQIVHRVNISSERLSVCETAAPAPVGMPTEDATALDQCRLASAELMKVLSNMIEMFGPLSPSEMLAALNVAVKTVQGVRTPNAAISAFMTYGKYSEVQHVGAKRRRLGNIAVQSTSVGRRRKCLRGCRAGEAGRPRKTELLRQNMHSYALPVWRKRAAAPHNLSVAVHGNASNGRTHSRK